MAIQVIPKMTGLPEVEATQVSIDVMTFSTEAVTVNTYYRVMDVDGKVLQSGNLPIDPIVTTNTFTSVMTAIEDATLTALTLVREV